LKYFSDGMPELPAHWDMGRVTEHMKMMYDSYVDMKKTELLVEILAQQTIGEANDGEQGAANALHE
jgi:hypothetical protein